MPGLNFKNILPTGGLIMGIYHGRKLKKRLKQIQDICKCISYWKRGISIAASMKDHPSVRTKWWFNPALPNQQKKSIVLIHTPPNKLWTGTYWDWRSRAWRSYYETKGNYMNVTLITNHWFQNGPRLQVSGRKSNLKTGFQWNSA